MQCKLDYCEKEITATLWDYTTVPLWSCLFVQKFRSSVTPIDGYGGYPKLHNCLLLTAAETVGLERGAELIAMNTYIFVIFVIFGFY